MIRRFARHLLKRLGVDLDATPAQRAHALASRGVTMPSPVAPDRHAPASPGRNSAASPTPWFTGFTEQDIAALPDAACYAPLFSPWRGLADVTAAAALARPWTLVSDDRCYVLQTLARQALALDGDFVECGVYRGGTAMILAKVLGERPRGGVLHLYDTFEGMPATDPTRDLHQAGDYADTSAVAVESRVRAVNDGATVRLATHAGRIPVTFAEGAPVAVAIAHVDVDIHRSVLDCCEFLYPRLVDGGMLVFDDYGFPTCPGARAAVDAFFRDKPERPLVLQTGQAIVHRLPARR